MGLGEGTGDKGQPCKRQATEPQQCVVGPEPPPPFHTVLAFPHMLACRRSRPPHNLLHLAHPQTYPNPIPLHIFCPPTQQVPA